MKSQSLGTNDLYPPATRGLALSFYYMSREKTFALTNLINHRNKMVHTFVCVRDVGLKIMRQTQKLSVISGNRNKQRTCYFCVLARKFPSKLSSQPLYGWGWESGQKERELKLKAALTKRRQRLAGVRRGRGFLILVALSVENFFLCLSSWPSLYLSTDSVYVVALLKAVLLAECPPSLESVTVQRVKSIDGPSWPPPLFLPL